MCRIRGPRSNVDIESTKFSTIYASQSSILNYSIDDSFEDEEDDVAIALKSQNQIVAQALQKVENFTLEDEDLSNFDNDDPEKQAARINALQEMMGALEGLNSLLPLPSKDYGAARARRSRDMVEALRGCQTLECVRVAHRKPPGPARFNFPHFFIIGWQKTATTSLFAYLNRHSQVSRPWDKEPEFFSDQCDYTIPSGCRKNETVHYLHHVLRLLRYTGYDGRIATYEASTHYSRNGGRMAKDLYDLFPWLKIVVSLRDPISRAASMLVHMIDKQIVAKGNEVGGCLSAHNMDLGYCLLNESQISGDDWGGPTEYYGPLKAWAEAFPRDQIFVTQYENLTLDAERDELRRLKIFLNLNPDLPSDSVGLGLHNARKKKFNPDGWPMRRQVYEQIVDLVRKDCKAVTELISEYGWGDGDAWMASWERVWADNLATCDENGDCMIQLT